jgi:ferrochelatase
MKIEKLVEIVDATLTNTTTKTELNSATLYSKKVEEGDLFIAQNIQDIDEAIKNGAVAVLYEDEELELKGDIAFLKVTSTKEAALKLLAYIIDADEELYLYLLKPKTLSFFKMIQLEKKNIEYLPDDWIKAFESMLNSDKAIFLSTDEEFVKALKPKIKTFSKSAFGYNVEDTLFRSTFRVEKFVYQHKKMTPFHLPNLLQAVELCNIHKLPYSIDRINYTKHFMPIFIDEETFIQKAHINDHVVIITDNLEDISNGREYAKEAKVVMSKSIVFTPPKTKVENYTKPTIFHDSTSLVSAVKTTSFNYGFVYTDKREDYEALKEYFNGLSK